MNRKLLLACIAAGLVAPAIAQTPPTVNLSVDGVADTRSLTLNSMDFSGGTLSISVTSSGSGGGGENEPTEIVRTLTVNAPTGGTIRRTDTNAIVSGTIQFTYMSNETVPSITLQLVPDSGFNPASWTNACSATAASSNCTLTMNMNRTVGATFQQQVSGACGALPTGVNLIPTTATGVRHSSTMSSVNTSRNVINSYSFTSPASGQLGRVDATRVNGGEGKLVVITECPGAISTPVSTGKCTQYSSESSTVWFASRATSASSRNNCILDPNKTYYANVVNRSTSTSSTSNCTTNCGYYFLIE